MTPLARELRLALARRKRSILSVAREAGISHSSIYNILRIDRVPTMDNAEAIAEVLDWAPIVTITRDLRTKVCPICGATFLDRNRTNASRTCSTPCSRTHYVRTVRDPEEAGQRASRVQLLQGELGVTKRRLAMLQDAVLATCMECSERTLICRIPECGLQVAGVSPARLPENRKAVA